MGLGLGLGLGLSSRVMPAALMLPANTVLPSIGGVAMVGQELTASAGSWTGTPTSYAYQWKADGVNVGSDSATYTPVVGDVGKVITVTVTAANAAGDGAPATSPGTDPVEAAGALTYAEQIIVDRRAMAVPTYTDPAYTEIHVTNLNNSGTGSLRAAVTTQANVKVIFDVAGEITVTSDLKVTYNNIIIAGETAPSPGITVRGDFVPMMLMGSGIVCRHIRLANNGGSGTGFADRDAGQVVTGMSDHAGGNIENTGFRNCTFLWSADELASLFPNTAAYPERLFQDLFVEDCLFAEPVWNDTIRPADRHQMGLLIGSPNPNTNPAIGGGATGAPVQRALVARNLFHSCRERMPRWGHGTSGWSVNNVISNPGRLGKGDFGYDPTGWPAATYPTVVTKVAHVGNVGWRGLETETILGKFSQGLPANSQIYWPAGSNEFEGAAWDVEADDITQAGFDPTVGSLPIAYPSGLSVMDKSLVEEYVLTHAGARPWDYHYTDDRLITEAANREGALAFDWPPEAPQTLAPLSWVGSANDIPEDAETGDVVGTLTGMVSTSVALSLVDDAGGLFAINTATNEITFAGAFGALDYETATSHNITVRQSLSGATNTPLDTVLTIDVTDVAEVTAKTVAELQTYLGSKCRRLWTADDDTSITHTGATCTAWVDKVAGQSLPVVGAPQYAATGTNIANPVVIFDGTDDAFRSAAGPLNASYPSGTAASWLWMLVDQTGTGAAVRSWFGYGSTGNQEGRLLEKVSSSSVMRLRIGRNSGGVIDTGNVFTGAHTVGGRYENGGTNVSGSFDDNDIASAALAFSTPSASGTRTAIGCNLQSTAGQFAIGEAALFMVTDDTLTADDIAEIRRTFRAYRLGTI